LSIGRLIAYFSRGHAQRRSLQLASGVNDSILCAGLQLC
jgi:hypothetical protein